MTTKKYTLDQLTGPAPATWKIALANIGLLAIAVGTCLPLLHANTHPALAPMWWKYVYAAGAAIYLIAKLITPYKGEHSRIKRLYRIESWSAIFFCVAAFFLFYNGTVSRDSWAFTLAGGILVVFTTIAIPRVMRKSLDTNSKSTTKK